ncbi:6-bladed beta-propeller [Candidatus Palauibacter sp.]|uniref:6-bladed beta-propeller n=1 Tax=Candidatus Palauibacter sp. TaxID=3101350 RepID=UPI003AF237D9
MPRASVKLPGSGLLVPALLAAGGLAAQDRPNTLALVSSLTVPDSVPLTFVEQLVPSPDGSAFLLDAQTDRVLSFQPDGTFRRQIGRRGEGPGELLSPWRLGLLGQDTLWVVDARQRRISLYDAATGESLADLGPDTWTGASAGGELPRRFAVLADHSVVTVKWGHEDVLADVRAHHVMGRQRDPSGAPLAVLNVQDRLSVVPLPAAGRGLQLRNPFSHGDMLAIDPLGRHFSVVRRPRPSGTPAFFTVERHSVLAGRTDSISVPYAPRTLAGREVRAWAADLGAVKQMVHFGLFPSLTAGIDAVLDALDEPDYYPPVRNLGRGIEDEAVLVDSEGAMWFQVSETADRVSNWIVVSDGGNVSHVTVAGGIRLLAVHGELVWGEVRDGFGVPSLHVYQIQPSGR